MTAEFAIGPSVLDFVEHGTSCFVELHCGHAGGELRRSVRDRVLSRFRTRSPVAVVPFFEDGYLVMVRTPVAPFISGVVHHGAHLRFHGRLESGQSPPIALVGDTSGAIEHHLDVDVDSGGDSCTFSLPVSELRPGVDYYIAFIERSNPGVPIPVSVHPDVVGRAIEHIAIRAGVDGQATIRSKDRPALSLGAEIRRRMRR